MVRIKAIVGSHSISWHNVHNHEFSVPQAMFSCCLPSLSLSLGFIALLNPMVIENPVTGRNVVAGVSTELGGTTNFNFGVTPQLAEAVHRPFSIVPFHPDPHFVNRPAISQWLQSTLVGPGCRAALVGLGGVGYAPYVRSQPFLTSTPNAMASEIVVECTG